MEEAGVQRGRVPLVNGDFGRAELLDQARDEVEDVVLQLAGDEAGELGAEELEWYNVSSTKVLSGIVHHLQKERRREGRKNKVAVGGKLHVAGGDERVDERPDDHLGRLEALRERQQAVLLDRAGGGAEKRSTFSKNMWSSGCSPRLKACWKPNEYMTSLE